MEITAALVKELRDLSGAGMMDCKRALQDTDGDVAKAFELLREKGIASAAKRAGRAANQGLVESYIHFNNTVGTIVEGNCETDFVASPAAPRFVSRDEIPTDVLESERRIFEMQAKEMGKPDNVVPNIVEGKMKAFYEQTVLLDQPYVKDDSKTIQQLLDEVGAKVGEKVVVRRFTRYKLGEESE